MAGSLPPSAGAHSPGRFGEANLSSSTRFPSGRAVEESLAVGKAGLGANTPKTLPGRFRQKRREWTPVRHRQSLGLGSFVLEWGIRWGKESAEPGKPAGVGTALHRSGEKGRPGWRSETGRDPEESGQRDLCPRGTQSIPGTRRLCRGFPGGASGRIPVGPTWSPVGPVGMGRGLRHGVSTHPVPVIPSPASLPVPLLGSGINNGAVSVPPLPLLGFLGRKSRVFEEIDVGESGKRCQWSCPASALPGSLS